jgi:hypothetical protein
MWSSRVVLVRPARRQGVEPGRADQPQHREHDADDLADERATTRRPRLVIAEGSLCEQVGQRVQIFVPRQDPADLAQLSSLVA